MTPLSDYVILTTSKEEQDKGGIKLSDVSRNRVEVGVVEGAGPDCSKEITKGKKVVFNPFTPKKIKLGGRDFLVIRAKEIFAVL